MDMIMGSFFLLSWCAIVYSVLEMHYEAEAERESNAWRTEERSQ